jgi:hypothetical protein
VPSVQSKRWGCSERQFRPAVQQHDDGRDRSRHDKEANVLAGKSRRLHLTESFIGVTKVTLCLI